MPKILKIYFVYVLKMFYFCLNKPKRHTMTHNMIKQIIQDLVKSYINGYGVPADAYGLARGYWELRDDNEIDRDTKAGVNFNDYEMWVKTAIADYETNLILTKFK